MQYTVQLTVEVKDKIRALPETVRQETGHRLFLLQEDMSGNIKKLKGSENEYRLRVGSYRVIFELEGRKILVYDVGQRKDIYR